MRFELRVLRRSIPAHDTTLASVAGALSSLGSLAVLGSFAAVSSAALAYRGRSLDALTVLVAGVGAVALANVVKVIVDRPRPPVSHLTAVVSASFPSQHAAQAAAIVPALVYVAVPAGRRRRAALLLAATTAGAIGASRALLGVHYPTDVLAGWTLGGAWLMLVLRALRPAETRRASGPDPPP